MRHLRAQYLFGIAVVVVLIAPIGAFAFYTRATTEDDISGRMRADREFTARLATTVVRQRVANDAAALARFAARTDLAQALRERNADALRALVAQFATPDQFQFVGVVSASGEILARAPEGNVDQTFGVEVATDAARVRVLREPYNGWTFKAADTRAPFRGTSVGAIVVPAETVPDPVAVYGLLPRKEFETVFAPLQLPPGRTILVFDEKGRLVAGTDSTGAAGEGDLPYRDLIARSADTIWDTVARPADVPDLPQTLTADLGTETTTIFGHERLAVHVPVLPGHWALYLLDSPSVVLAGERRLTEALTIGAATASAAALALATAIAVLVDRIRRQRTELARLAVTDERLRFARDLHDLLGHSLSLIAIKAELATRLLRTDASAAVREMNDLETVARDGLRDVRAAVTSYRQPTLDGELESARSVLELAGIECHVEHDLGAVPVEIESLFAWTVREGVTNVIRHSGALRCDIRLSHTDHDARAEIADDGSGTTGGHGFGLRGIRERAAAVGGVVETGPSSNKGFHVRVVVPLGTR